MTQRLTRFVATVLCGMFAGFLVGVLVLELSMRDVDGSVYTQMRQLELDRLDTLATVTLLPALVALVILIAAQRRQRGRERWLPVAAFLLLAGVLVLTLLVNLPINADQRDWIVQLPPTDWASTRDRWQLAHAARTVAASIAFGILCWSAGTGPRPAVIAFGALKASSQASDA